MNIKLKITFLIISSFYFSSHVFSQTTLQVGLMPSVNYNKKVNSQWSFNGRIESRQLLRHGTWNDEAGTRYEYALTDLSALAAYKTGFNTRAAAGYLIRFRDGSLVHRFIQQFTMLKKLFGFRLAHRFVTDQTFCRCEAPEFRLRYRISTEIPLDGEVVDAGELYVKINNEYLHSLQASEYDLELRLVPVLGFDIKNMYKVEAGLNYRVNGFIHDKTRHSFWMMLNFFIDM